MTGPDKNGSKKTGPENRFCDFTKTKLRFGNSDTSCLLTFKQSQNLHMQNWVKNWSYLPTDSSKKLNGMGVGVINIENLPTS